MKGDIHMSTYELARQKTKHSIIMAFWNLYTDKEIDKITVRSITEQAGIHRATFYLHFDHVYAILDCIKDTQLSAVRYVCTNYTSSENNYADFLCAMQKLYTENELFLKPLLCEYRDSGFAMEYRRILKEKLQKDIGLPLFSKNSANYFVIDSFLSGLIETFISCLHTKKIPLEQAYLLASGIVNEGALITLQKHFNIKTMPF